MDEISRSALCVGMRLEEFLPFIVPTTVPPVCHDRILFSLSAFNAAPLCRARLLLPLYTVIYLVVYGTL